MKISLLLIFLSSLLCFGQFKRSLSTRKLYDQALETYEKGNTAEALTLFEQCAVEDPTFTEAHINISFIQFENKKYDLALSSAKTAATYNKFQSVIYFQIGKCFYHLEQFDSSSFYFKKGLGLGSGSELDYIYLGKSLLAQGANREALNYYSKAIELNSKNPISYNERGSAYYHLGEYELAEADFKQSLELNPNSAGVYSNLANVALAMEDNELAISYINEGILQATADEKIQLLILKGNYYKNTGDFDNAAVAYNQAYELDSENAVILNNQASILIELEDFEGAFAKCNLALELQPEMMEAYFNRGIVNEMLRHVEEACIDWEQAFILGSEKAEEFLNSPICNE